MEGVSKELAAAPLSSVVRWDDMPAEALREAVMGVHNLIFGQLGALSMTMHELGLALHEAEVRWFMYTLLHCCFTANISRHKPQSQPAP